MPYTALITGANSGLGLATAQALARQNFDLIFLVRSREKGEWARQQVLQQSPQARVELFFADLTNLAALRQAAEAIQKRYDRIDRLINNAGYAPASIEYTPEGYERSFIANHLGHFVLTFELFDLLRASGEARIINVSSAAHALGKARRFFVKNNTALNIWTTYGDGKLANILFTQELARRLEGQPITAYALHPGVVNSQFGQNFLGSWKVGFGLLRPFMITPEEGARTAVYLSTASVPESYNGKYFSKSRPTRILSTDANAYNGQLLWKLSEQAAGIRWLS
ncbi:short-chain dehydrogenase [Siphonobacter sp. BAB-5405]|uniref:SDR family NAD(P)-dependent oxidoreductase n=1 Tax=Siphonobacter sp. BAB-5405 TaxID=1864825 RepID=UPI000C8100DD|nr:SDR family NAD(P)-dependent oxidoreductase [Siphonobacter sp. BAB-5405]PMD98637.1 short-chain dehydrogenase [Siphonobacter sp. BAB-5405]